MDWWTPGLLGEKSRASRHSQPLVRSSTNPLAHPLLLLRVAGAILFLGSGKGLLEADHVFARTQRVERSRFLLDVFLTVGRGLDRETDAALGLVDLDDARFDLLPDL